MEVFPDLTQETIGRSLLARGERCALNRADFARAEGLFTQVCGRSVRRQIDPDLAQRLPPEHPPWIMLQEKKHRKRGPSGLASVVQVASGCRAGSGPLAHKNCCAAL